MGSKRIRIGQQASAIFPLAIALALLTPAGLSRAASGTSTNSGNWFDGAIWDSHSSPTNFGDAAAVRNNVSLGYSAGIPLISLSSLSISGGGYLSVSGEGLTVQSGSVNGGALSSMAGQFGSLALSGSNNSVTSCLLTNGTVTFSDSYVETITSSHLVIQGNLLFGDANTVNGYIENWGQVWKTGGTGTAYLNNTTLNNYGGTIRVDSGKLVFTGGGNNTNGTFVVGAGAAVDVTGNSGYVNSWSGQMTGSGAGQVQLNAGTLTASSALTMNFPANLFWWTGGSLGGSPVTNLGTINLGSTNTLYLGCVLYNANAVWHTNSATLNLGSLVNLAAGTYYLAGDVGTSGGAFNNWGVLRKNGGTGTSAFGAALNDYSGAIQVDTGRLVLSGGGTHSNALFNVAAGAEVDVNSATTWSGPVSGLGAGQVVSANSTIAIAASGAALNFPTNFFWLTGGSISGTNGTNIGVMHILSTNAASLSGTFYNSAIIRHSGAGNLYISGSHLENLAGGTYELAADGGTLNGYIDNWGLLHKSGGTGNSLLNNTTVSTYGGIVQVDSGKLTIAGGGSNYNATFTVASNAVLDVTGGYAANNWAGQATGSGAGMVLLASGTVTSGANLALNYPSNLFWWTGGTVAGSTGTNIGVITVWPTNSPTVSGTLYNAGLIRHTNTGALFISGHVSNLASGAYDLLSDGAIASGTFDNAGLLRKSGGSGASVVSSTFNNNSGAVEVDAAALTLNGGTTSTNSAYTLLAGATLNLTSGAGTRDTFNVGAGATLNITDMSLTGETFNVSTGGLVKILDPTTSRYKSNLTFQVSSGGLVDIEPGNVTAYWSGVLTGSGAGQVVLRNGGTDLRANPGLTLSFPAGEFLFSGGTLDGPNGGGITNLGVVEVLATNAPRIYETFYNRGLIHQTGTGNLAVVSGAWPIDNQAAGTYEFAGDGGLSGGMITNSGLVRKSAGSGTSTISSVIIHNGGSFRLDTGILSLNLQPYTQGGGGFTITIGGTNAGQWGELACGQATLGGPLNVMVSNGVALKPGSQFQIVACTNRSGIFTATNAPAGLSVLYTATGVFLTVNSPVQPKILSPQALGGNYTFGFQSSVGQSYTVLHNDDLATTNWVQDTNLLGNGALNQIFLPLPTGPQRFYRLREP